MCSNFLRPVGRILSVLCTALPALVAQGVPAGSPDYFELKIRPVLANQCYSCHTDTHLGDLRLDSREAMLKGGKRGAALVPGDPEKSLLVSAVRQTDANLKMPMGGKLKDSEIEDLVAWVKAGAVWPKAAAAPAAPMNSVDGNYTIAPERKNFWSLLPLKDVKPPVVKDARWNRDPIDRFILAHLEKEGLKPVKAATKRDLLAACDVRSHRSAAYSRRDRGFRKRPSSRRFCEGGGSPVGVAELRRAMGTHLAGCGPLRRGRLSQLKPQSAWISSLPERIRLSRLGDSGDERRSAVRPIREGSAGGRFAGCEVAL